MQLLSEWQPQAAVIFAWPDTHTDWVNWLDQAQQTYIQLITAVCQTTPVILLVPASSITHVSQQFAEHLPLLLVPAKYNDTWTRDYAFLSCRQSDGQICAVEYQFNGWGEKFDAHLDNLVNRHYLQALLTSEILDAQLVCEGGALEINDQGTLLSTASCLLNPKRNGALELAAYRLNFQTNLGAQQVHIFEHGHLQGDDTDGHIDTLVRFTPDGHIVYQGAENCPHDPHFPGLHTMAAEIAHHLPNCQLFALPLPTIYADDGERLPASYANYLITNGQILMPQYNVAEDELALQIVAEAHPRMQVTPIDASVLIQQYGSIHCISMQIAEGLIKAEIVAQMKQGVSIFETA